MATTGIPTGDNYVHVPNGSRGSCGAVCLLQTMMIVKQERSACDVQAAFSAEIGGGVQEELIQLARQKTVMQMEKVSKEYGEFWEAPLKKGRAASAKRKWAKRKKDVYATRCGWTKEISDPRGWYDDRGLDLLAQVGEVSEHMQLVKIVDGSYVDARDKNKPVCGSKVLILWMDETHFEVVVPKVSVVFYVLKK